MYPQAELLNFPPPFLPHVSRNSSRSAYIFPDSGPYLGMSNQIELNNQGMKA